MVIELGSYEDHLQTEEGCGGTLQNRKAGTPKGTFYNTMLKELELFQEQSGQGMNAPKKVGMEVENHRGKKKMRVTKGTGKDEINKTYLPCDEQFRFFNVINILIDTFFRNFSDLHIIILCI